MSEHLGTKSSTTGPAVAYRSVISLVVAVLLLVATSSHAASTGDQVCKKMIAEGRGGALSQHGCLCYYRVAEAVLEAVPKGLLFESWRNGTNNMQAMAALPNQKQVKK